MRNFTFAALLCVAAGTNDPTLANRIAAAQRELALPIAKPSLNARKKSQVVLKARVELPPVPSFTLLPPSRTNTIRFQYDRAVSGSNFIWAIRTSTNAGATKQVIWLQGMPLDAEGFATVTNEGPIHWSDSVGSPRR